MIYKKEFWKNKKVLITGFTGFKGSWMILMLKSLGSNIYGYSLDLKVKKSIYYRCNLKRYLKSYVIGDIKDKNKLSKFINKNSFDIIFHFAAQPLVIESYKNRFETFSTNINGTINLLEILSKKNHPFVFVNITTDKVYKPNQKLYQFKETDTLFGFDPYSISKVCSDIITNSFNYFNLKPKQIFMSARSGNVIGGGDYSKNRIIPDYFKAKKRKSSLELRNPHSIRPWQHVLDPLFGYLLLGQKYFNSKSVNEDDLCWNFGPNRNSFITVKDLISKINSLEHKKINIKYKKNIYKETKLLALNSNKANKNLQWRSVWNLKKTIFYTYEWYKFEINKKNLEKITLNQIQKYFDDQKILK